VPPAMIAPGGRPMTSDPSLHVREHGTRGPRIIVLHGGPAAPGEAAPLARGLAGAFRVLEPWQRGSGPSPLTVATHVEDLHALIVDRCDGPAPGIVGESWGAMLALAYAAAHPPFAGPVVLVGCGTFDKASRARMNEILTERTTPEIRNRLRELDARSLEPGERLLRKYSLMRAMYDFDPVEEPASDPEIPPFDARAHAETWGDMLRLQDEGIYPAAFAAIRAPVLMLHGSYDPHPGSMIRAGLAPLIPQLEYREWPRCGHSPWLERNVREEFFTFLREWLLAHLPA
jgi:pimeloyl-ACP methyl ester carboxylesterase